VTPPATRVIALAHVDKNDAPDELNQIDPDTLVEVVLMGVIPDSEEVIAVVCMTAEDQHRNISWQTTMPHKQFSDLVKMRSIINLPKSGDAVQNDQMGKPKFGKSLTKDRTTRSLLAISGKVIAKFWKAKTFTDKETTRLTIKYLRRVSDLLPDLWKLEATQLANKLEKILFKSPRLKREVASLCNFTADLIEIT